MVAWARFAVYLCSYHLFLGFPFFNLNFSVLLDFLFCFFESFHFLPESLLFTLFPFSDFHRDTTYIFNL